MAEFKEIISSDKAPPAIGPYSAGVRVGNFIYTSGQIGIDPETGEVVPGGVEAETRRALINLKHVLEAAGTSLGAVVKTTVFLKDMGDYSVVNDIYSDFFTESYPARSAVQVAALPKDVTIEIEAVAVIG